MKKTLLILAFLISNSIFCETSIKDHMNPSYDVRKELHPSSIANHPQDIVEILGEFELAKAKIERSHFRAIDKLREKEVKEKSKAKTQKDIYHINLKFNQDYKKLAKEKAEMIYKKEIEKIEKKYSVYENSFHKDYKLKTQKK